MTVVPAMSQTMSYSDMVKSSPPESKVLPEDDDKPVPCCSFRTKVWCFLMFIGLAVGLSVLLTRTSEMDEITQAHSLEAEALIDSCNLVSPSFCPSGSELRRTAAAPEATAGQPM